MDMERWKQKSQTCRSFFYLCSMKYQRTIQDFISEYADADTNRLRLMNIQADFDVAWAILQIEARKKIRHKLPDWAANPNLVFPSLLSTEQCSSEQTARYKQRLIQSGDLADLTGGLGIDTCYLAQKATQVVYVERMAEYCQAARSNFKWLGADNITVVEDDSTHFIQYCNRCFDTLYIDPARRGSDNKRIFALDECEPNVVALMPQLLRHGRRIVVKVSPMADISAILTLLPEVGEVHVVSVRNECKELLLVINSDTSTQEMATTIHCVDMDAAGRESTFTFRLDEERQLPHSAPCDTVARYLYEPNSSILKAGAYKSVAAAYGVDKLQINSHLYTSDCYLPDFPGRKFEVVEVIDFNAKSLKTVGKQYPRINLSTRNFPLTANELQKRLKCKDGSEFYLFATTLADNRKVLIITRKAINA